MEQTIYNDRFYDSQWEVSKRSAKEIVPILIALTQPKSVVDVGCGVGTWLSVFREHGITDVFGIDGDYINRKRLLIPKEAFVGMDLANISASLPKKDLAICLEVAEHIPKENDDRFLNILISLAPVVCFSAAIPGQGGAAHVNEQWPDYWGAKFTDRGFECFDVIRPAIWSNPHIEPWYCQNTFLYIKKEHICYYSEVQTRVSASPKIPLRLVHPELFNRFVSLHYISSRRLVCELIARIKRKVLRK
jgi:SAM-dependent methyltransferase